MKNIILGFLLTTISVMSSAQTNQNTTLKYNWADTTGLYFNTYFGIRQYFNEVWGWSNSTTGAEYAIIGAADGTYFFDVTNTDSCYQIDYIPAKARAQIHRDYKTFGNYVYMVADEGNNSLQIYDMTTLPDSVTLAYDNDEFVVRSHNIFIDEGVLYMVSPQTNANNPTGFRMLDLNTNPAQPTLIGDFYLPTDGSQGTHIHDLYVRDKRAFCSNGTSGYFIYDVADPNNIYALASIESYSEQGYNHNSWMNEDCSTIFFTDENLGMGIKSYDVTDLDNITLNTIFRSNVGAMAHNVLVHGNLLYASYYHDGVVVFDITDPASPVKIAQYDTYQELNGYTNYQGCWGVYPYLPSGTILASDFENGLFVIQLDSITPVYNPINCQDTVVQNINLQYFDHISLQPNPAKDMISLNNSEKVTLEIFNSTGERISITSIRPYENVNIGELNKGIYFANVHINNKIKTYKFIKE